MLRPTLQRSVPFSNSGQAWCFAPDLATIDSVDSLWVHLPSPEGQVAASLAHGAGLPHRLELMDSASGGAPVRLQTGEGVREGDAALATLVEGAGPTLSPDGAERLRQELFEPIRTVAETKDQGEYEAACRIYFDVLRAQDRQLGQQRFLGGDQPKLADLWLFAALVRHDAAYVPFFKLTLARIEDFENLDAYARDMFQTPGLGNFVRLGDIRRFYAGRSERLNPKGKVPVGGLPDLWQPQRRDRLAKSSVSVSPKVGGTEEAPSIAARGWVRPQSRHRHAVGTETYPLEAGRYHLYVSHNCPWSHRVTLGRALLGLESAVSLDVLFYRRDPERGWQFRPEEPGCTPDTVHGARFIREIYEREASKEKSVPVLYDKVRGEIVNNESAEILRMLHTTFRPLAERPLDLYPEPLQADIEVLNQWIYQRINNGAYKAGFTSDQEAYEEAAEFFFRTLDHLEASLENQAFLLGDAPTEADVRLFPTLFRFDDVYFTRFLLNRKKLPPRLRAWRTRMLALPGARDASNLEHCKKGYFGRTGNGLVPLTPEAV